MSMISSFGSIENEYDIYRGNDCTYEKVLRILRRARNKDN